MKIIFILFSIILGFPGSAFATSDLEVVKAMDAGSFDGGGSADSFGGDSFNDTFISLDNDHGTETSSYDFDEDFMKPEMKYNKRMSSNWLIGVGGAPLPGPNEEEEDDKNEDENKIDSVTDELQPLVAIS